MEFGALMFGWAFLWGIIGIIVALDASGRARSGGFWFLVVLFLGVFGLFAYVLSVGTAGDDKVDKTDDYGQEGRKRESTKCRNCGNVNPIGASYCANCGDELTSECLNCGTPLRSEEIFCPECGAAQEVEIVENELLEWIKKPFYEETQQEEKDEEYFRVFESVTCYNCDSTIYWLSSQGHCRVCGTQLVNPNSIPDGVQTVEEIP